MLKEVTSWFDPAKQSRGVVEDVQINAGRGVLDEARAQVEAARKLFGGEGAPRDRVLMLTAPFRLGEGIDAGPYQLRFKLPEQRIVALDVSTSDLNAPAQVPVCVFDAEGRLLFAPTVALAEEGGKRQGRVELRGSQVWNTARFISFPGRPPAGDAVPGVDAAAVPFRWNEPMSINAWDSNEGKLHRDEGEEQPRAARTCAFRVQVNRRDDGSARAKLDVVSIDGPREFYLDLSLALVSSEQELLAAGNVATSLRVESSAVERQYEIELGTVPPGKEPEWLIVGVAPGNIISKPTGARWLTSMQEPPFDVATMLGASDESCWRGGLGALSRRLLDARIWKAFFDDDPGGLRASKASLARQALLKPHRDALRDIARAAREPDVIAGAVRLLAYTDAETPAAFLEPLLNNQDAAVQDAVAAALTYLGSDEHFERLQPILAREAPGGKASFETNRAFHSLEHDVLIALARQGSDAAIDILGNVLLGDLGKLKLATDDQQRESLQGRADRIYNLCALLGNSRQPRCVRWLIAAADLLAERPELANRFERNRLIASILRFEPQTHDRVVAEIETGANADAWVYALNKGPRSPNYVAAVGTFLGRDDVTTAGMRAGIAYLQNADSAEVVAALQGCYDRGIHKDEPRVWLELCEALAKKGDGRGLNDAFEALVQLERSAEPPTGDKALRNWTRTRDALREQAERVASSAREEDLSAFLLQKAKEADRDEQRVILDLLWAMAELPPAFTPVLQEYSQSSDEKVKKSAKRLLER